MIVSTTPRKVGRPSDYTDELADKICDLLAEGKSLAAICRMRRMPARKTVYAWIHDRMEFRNKYQTARDIQADALADRAIDMLDSATAESAQVDALKLRGIQWITGKLAPKRYGTDRMETETSVTVTLADLVAESFKPKVDGI